jgi:hypothetical protein
MNNNSASHPLMEQRLRALYAMNPTADFIDRLGKDLQLRHPANPPARRFAPTQSRRWLRPALAGILLLALIGLLFIATPQGRALARQILGYFQTTTEKYFPPSFKPARTPVPTASIPAGLVAVAPVPAVNKALCGETISPLSSSFRCQLINAQNEVRFEILSFPADRLKTKFSYLHVDRELPEILLVFYADGVYYRIEQGLGDFPSDCAEPWCGVAEDAVQAVHVGSYPAEYAAGGWVSPQNSGKWWYSNVPQYRLRWKEGGRWFEIAVDLAPQDGMKEKMIGLAENLVSISQGIEKLAGYDTPPVEQQAGYDILEPGLLPKDFQFCGVNYSHDDQALSQGFAPYLADLVTVDYCLIVGRRGVAFLHFDQMPISIPADLKWKFFNVTSLHQEVTAVKDVQIGGIPGQFLANELGQALIWTKEDLNLMITFTQSSAYGGRLDQTDLIAIAVSMR